MSLRYPPAAYVDDWVKVLSGNRLHYHKLIYSEGMMGSQISTINFGAIAAATSATAPGTTVKALQTTFQIQSANHMLGLWARILDSFELAFWVPGGIQDHYMQSWTAQLSSLSASVDPEGDLVKFFIYGVNNDSQFVAQNWHQTALTRARALFWGWHYVLDDEVALKDLPPGAAEAAKFIPAQGWGG